MSDNNSLCWTPFTLDIHVHHELDTYERRELKKSAKYFSNLAFMTVFFLHDAQVLMCCWRWMWISMYSSTLRVECIIIQHFIYMPAYFIQCLINFLHTCVRKLLNVLHMNFKIRFHVFLKLLYTVFFIGNILNSLSLPTSVK